MTALQDYSAAVTQPMLTGDATRFDEVVAEALAEVGDGTAVFVSHGAMIRMWAASRADNIDLQFASDRPLENTAMVVVEGSGPGTWHVDLWTPTALGGPELTDLQTQVAPTARGTPGPLRPFMNSRRVTPGHRTSSRRSAE